MFIDLMTQRFQVAAAEGIGVLPLSPWPEAVMCVDLMSLPFPPLTPSPPPPSNLHGGRINSHGGWQRLEALGYYLLRGCWGPSRNAICCISAGHTRIRLRHTCRSVGHTHIRVSS